jgi:ring-1,2-phenylacetyl-CoA epoxidase subunit PaaC
MVSPTSDSPLPDVAAVADSCFVASHRLTEWVSNAPSMEEDVAIGNIALDLLGQARGLFAVLGNEDELAYFRDAPEWHNLVICELPNGDFAHTMLRLLFISQWLAQVWPRLIRHEDERISGVAEKAVKENAYHRRHASNWVIRLGDGTEESNGRMIAALEELSPYVTQFADPAWVGSVSGVLAEATLGSSLALAELSSVHPADPAHTPYLADLLDDMQSLARAHPGATW